MEPKIEMKKKIVRQSDLIHTLERNLERKEIRDSSEVLELRRKVKEQQDLIESM